MKHLAFEPTQTTWGDLVTVKQGKYVAKSDLASSRSEDTPVPTVGANGVLGYVPKASYQRLVPLVTCRGSNCGLIQYPLEPVWVNNNAMALDAGTDEENSFIYYLALNTDFNDVVSGSAQPQITAGPLKNKAVSVPPREYWPGIAATLSALDDKIESNRQAISLSEDLARSIFVKLFDLTQAVDGVALSELIVVNPRRVLRAGTPATYVGMSSLPEFSAEVYEWEMKEAGSGQRFILGDVLMARITPCLENGKTAVVDMLQPGEVGWGSTEYIVLSPTGQISTPWIYCLVRDERIREFAIQSMTGTSGRQRFQADRFSQYRIVEPTEHDLITFNTVAEPLFARMTQLRDESRRLAALRDALLPGLLSGRVRANAGRE